MKAPFFLPAALRTTFARSTAILTSAAAIQNLMVLAVSPILSRLFSPEEFGAVGLLYAIAALPATASTGHYYLAVMQSRKRLELINIVALAWSCVVLTTIVAAAVVGLLYGFPHLFGDAVGSLGPLLLLVPLVMLTEGSLATGRIWDLRQADYRALFRNRLIETGGTIAPRRWPPGCSAQVPSALPVAGCWASARHPPTPRPKSSSAASAVTATGYSAFGASGSVAGRYWRFPQSIRRREPLGALCRQMPPLLLAAYFSVEAIGLYWMANRVLERPVLLLAIRN